MVDINDEIKRQFKEEIERIRFRSYRASQMEYSEASLYDFWLEKFEYLLYILILDGAIIGMYSDLKVKGTILAAPGILVTLFDAFNKIYCSKNDLDFVPILRTRAVIHNIAAAKWQSLQMKAESCLIMLNKKDLTVETVHAWYNDLCTEREKICANVIVQEHVYKKWNQQMNFEESYSRYTRMNAFFKQLLPSLEIGAQTVNPVNISENNEKELNTSEPNKAREWLEFIYPFLLPLLIHMIVIYVPKIPFCRIFKCLIEYITLFFKFAVDFLKYLFRLISGVARTLTALCSFPNWRPFKRPSINDFTPRGGGD